MKNLRLRLHPVSALLGLLVLLTAGFKPLPAGAQSILLNADEDRLFEQFHWLPYAFYSGSFGLGFGVGGSYSGVPYEETSFLGALTLGTKGSYNLVAAANDLRMPGFKRLYVRPLFMFGKYQDQYLYAGQNNPGYEGQRAGANDSDVDNYLEVSQWDNRIDLEFRYLLPLGHGADRENIVNRYTLREGFLASGATGGTSWNPLASGRSSLYVTPQWREQTQDNEELRVPLETWNVDVTLERDNRDFPYNATHGSFQRLSYKKDFTDTEILGEWDRWTAEYSKVFNLGANKRMKQQAVVFDVWTAYVPSWEEETVDGVVSVTRRPPPYDGAVLGGLERMRGYEDSRFHDKAAIYYSLEYRVVPQWQPLRHSRLLEWADISFWQWVLFAEAGQVAPHWNVDDLHDNLHVDGGFGLRGMIYKALCRLDFAFGEEGSRVTAMYGHPF